MQNANLKSRWVSLCRRGLIFGAASLVISLTAAYAADPFDEKNDKKDGTPSAGTGGSAEGKVHPLEKPLAKARESLEAVSAVKDYTATFDKSELVGRTMYQHSMLMKFRSEPFSVRLKFEKPAKNKGREVLYVAGENQGKLKAKEAKGLGSLVGTLNLDPKSREAMSEGRHPITEIGMQRMVEAVIRQWELESKYGEIEVEVFDSEETKVENRLCIAFRCTHPVKRDEFQFHQTVLYIDKETKFPIRVEQYGFPARQGGKPPLIEEYTYTDIQVNVGLQDQDFRGL